MLRPIMKRIVMKLRAAVSACPTLRTAAYWGTVIARDVRGIFASRAFDLGNLPTDVNIEPSNLCNANCVFCAYQHQTRPHQSISDDLARQIIDQARSAGVKRLGLTPIVGEPLVNRGLEDLIRYARRPPTPLSAGVTTNGLLLTQKRYLSLIEAGITHIAISMSYPDAEEYARVYRNPSFNTLMRNLEGVLDVYERSQCEVALGIRSSRPDGWNHPLFERARSAGWSVERNVFLDDWSGSVADEIRKHGLVIRPLRPKRLPCSMLYTGPHFLSDGRATACGCRDVDGGSELQLTAESLLGDMQAVYRSGEIESVRERFRRGATPAICASCRHYTPQFEGEHVSRRLAQTFADGVAATRDVLPRRRKRRQLHVLNTERDSSAS